MVMMMMMTMMMMMMMMIERVKQALHLHRGTLQRCRRGMEEEDYGPVYTEPDSRNRE